MHVLVRAIAGVTNLEQVLGGVHRRHINPILSDRPFLHTSDRRRRREETLQLLFVEVDRHFHLSTAMNMHANAWSQTHLINLRVQIQRDVGVLNEEEYFRSFGRAQAVLTGHLNDVRDRVFGMDFHQCDFRNPLTLDEEFYFSRLN